MEQWKQYKIGDLCSISSSKRIFAKEYQTSGIPFYRGKEVIEKQKGENVSTELYISEARYNEIKNKFGVPEEGDMLLTSVGTLGVPYVVKDETFYFKDGNLTWFGNFKGLNSKFLYYWFLSPMAKNAIDAKAIGSTQKALTIDALSKFEIDIPNVDVQNRIVSILSSLDNKIELNRRINDNLEQQAQALFDHYFDSGSIYLEDSIMGCLTDIAVYLNGLAMQKFPATDIERSLPVLKIKELGQRKCDDCSDRCSDSIDADYIIDNEDIIFSWSGTLMVDVWCGGKCGLNQHLFKVTPLKNYPRWFVYYWTNRHLKKFKLIAKDKAVTMGHIRRGDLENAEVAIPTNLNMLEINARINPLFQSIIDRRLEITKLENIRDALLPKLMSGELTINEI